MQVNRKNPTNIKNVGKPLFDLHVLIQHLRTQSGKKKNSKWTDAYGM